MSKVNSHNPSKKYILIFACWSYFLAVFMASFSFFFMGDYKKSHSIINAVMKSISELSGYGLIYILIGFFVYLVPTLIITLMVWIFKFKADIKNLILIALISALVHYGYFVKLVEPFATDTTISGTVIGVISSLIAAAITLPITSKKTPKNL